MAAKSTPTMLTNAEDYPTFAQEARAALMSEMVWSHVNQTQTKITPATVSNPTADEKREMRIHDEKEEKALGIILARLDPANTRLVEGKTAKEAWDILNTTHNKQDANRQYQLFQTMTGLKQEPNESLPSYLERMQLAANRLVVSLPSGTTPTQVIAMLMTFLVVGNLEPTEENDQFELNLSIAGKIDSTTIADAFRTEQMRRDTAAKAKESG